MRSFLVGTLWLVIACGDADDGGGTTMQGDCGLDIEVTGGYSWKTASVMNAVLGCGLQGTAGRSITVEALGPADGVIRSVNVLFGAPYTTRGPLSAGETGTFDVALSIEVQDEVIPWAQWQSAVNGCSFQVVKNGLKANSATRYIVGGTVMCPDALIPFDSPSSVRSIMVNPFEISSIEDYAP
jgi:hypothetical protein